MTYLLAAPPAVPLLPATVGRRLALDAPAPAAVQHALFEG